MNRYYVFFGMGNYIITYAKTEDMVSGQFPHAERIYQM
jgi:hypothetical protein